MRNSIILICLGILGLCIFLILHQKTREPITSEASSTATNLGLPKQLVANSTLNSTLARPKQLAVSNIAQPTSPYVPMTEVEKSNYSKQHLLADWQGRIDFFGKVVDESNNPIEGATVSFDWVEEPTEDGNRTATITSDSNGLFELHDRVGLSLGVSVSKAGYYSGSQARGSYNFGPLGGKPFPANPANPVVFHLLKKGTGTSLIAMKRNYGIPRDGTPVSINLETGAATTSESGDFVIRCWTHDAEKGPGGKYDWRCVVSIPGGGAITNADEFPFEAPENGYVPSLEINMPADRPDWTSDVDLKFYYRLADGRYGRMTFSMIAGGQHFCMINSVLNPTGSRDLEPAN